MGIDILDSIVTKITDKTYPNIKFYLHKDEINWKAQMDNMKEVMDIMHQPIDDAEAEEIMDS